MPACIAHIHRDLGRCVHWSRAILRFAGTLFYSAILTPWDEIHYHFVPYYSRLAAPAPQRMKKNQRHGRTALTAFVFIWQRAGNKLVASHMVVSDWISAQILLIFASFFSVLCCSCSWTRQLVLLPLLYINRFVDAEKNMFITWIFFVSALRFQLNGSISLALSFSLRLLCAKLLFRFDWLFSFLPFFFEPRLRLSISQMKCMMLYGCEHIQSIVDIEWISDVCSSHRHHCSC